MAIRKSQGEVKEFLRNPGRPPTNSYFPACNMFKDLQSLKFQKDEWKTLVRHFLQESNYLWCIPDEDIFKLLKAALEGDVPKAAAAAAKMSALDGSLRARLLNFIEMQGLACNFKLIPTTSLMEVAVAPFLELAWKFGEMEGQAAATKTRDCKTLSALILFLEAAWVDGLDKILVRNEGALDNAPVLCPGRKLQLVHEMLADNILRVRSGS